jgi:hypothetical protein
LAIAKLIEIFLRLQYIPKRDDGTEIQCLIPKEYFEHFQMWYIFYVRFQASLTDEKISELEKIINFDAYHVIYNDDIPINKDILKDKKRAYLIYIFCQSMYNNFAALLNK